MSNQQESDRVSSLWRQAITQCPNAMRDIAELQRELGITPPATNQHNAETQTKEADKA